MVTIDGANLYHVAVPMKLQLRHSQATRSVAENLVVELSLAGRTGLGECAPRPYVTGETVDSAWKAIASFDLRWVEQRLRMDCFEDAVASVEALDLPRILGSETHPALAAACAVELALLDCVSQHFHRPLESVARALGLPETMLRQVPARFPQGWAVGLGDPLETIPVSRAHYLKVKLGPDLEENVQRLREIRQAVGHEMPLCVDANMAWTLESAKRAIPRMAGFRISWYEEPLARGAFAEYAELRRVTRAPLMLDESLLTLEHGREALRQRSCDLFNIRLSKVGGFIPALRLAELALSHGICFQIGAHAGQMGILWAAGIRLATSLSGHVAFEGGLTRLLFDRQIIQQDTGDPEVFEEHDLPGPGLGVSLVGPDELAAFCPRKASWSGSRGKSWSVAA